ncbi:H/ACA ribonucleoprotein complex non-core subunit NAF1 isoform X2 [Folsomia candida]|uniref:H/ACA ribonucleoprotein complex non-core subunit NAF1 isoform X2 n=1 Tax=Folsomia candida TaxID=158441 RepID=UPI000B904EBC|nr:H/ACA ribonucleoprotein complex non-core subunit NAF1 isoform X2 [Folsomia candida]
MALSSRLGALSALAADYGDDDDEGEEEKEQDKKDIVMVIATTTTGENMEVDKKVKMEAVVAEDDKSIVKKVEISTMEQDKNEIETALAIVKKEDEMEEDSVAVPPLLAIVKKEGDEKNGTSDTSIAAIMPPASSPFTTFRNKEVTDDVETEDSEPDSALDSDDDTDKGKKSDKKQTGNSDDADLSSSDEEYDLSSSNAKSKAKKQPPRVKGEMNFDDLPPIQDLTISVPHDKAKPIGVIKSVVDPLVIVEAFPSTPALDLDSVLFLDQGDRALGRVFDVMGPVKQPWYCVRFNSMLHIEANGVTVGSLVYCAPTTQHASFVLLAQLEKLRGTDASWKDDIEPPPEVQEFSDDEKEREVKKKGKKRKVRVRAGGINQNPSNGSAPAPPPLRQPGRPHYNPRPPHHQRPAQYRNNFPNSYGGPQPPRHAFEYEQYLANLTASNYYRPPQHAYFPRQPDYSWHTHPAALHGAPPPPPPPRFNNANPYQHFNPPSVPWRRQSPLPAQQQRGGGGQHPYVPPLPPGTS